MDPYKLSLEVCHTRLYEKKAKIFSSLERLPFFSKLYVFQQLLRCYRSDLITSTKIVGIPFWTLTKCPLRFVTLDYTRKNAKIFFSLESLPFFSKICFQQPLRFFKIWSYYFRSETQITSWTLTKCSLRFVILDNSIIGEKKGQNLFFTRKVAFFSRIYVSKKPLGCYKSDLLTSTVIVRIPCEHL